MHQETPQNNPIKTLLILNIVSSIFSLSVVATLIGQGYVGFGKSYTTSTTCNAYQSQKYETQKEINFEVRFVASIIALLCLLGQMVSSIRSFLRIREIQQLRITQIFYWSEKELTFKYLCYSIAIMELLPFTVFYLSAMVEEGGCWKSVAVDWIILFIESVLAFGFALASWIWIVKYALRRPLDPSKAYETNIQLKQLRQGQSQMKNMFEIQGSELYKTVKRDNRQAKEPLLYENSPIPLYQSHFEASHNDRDNIERKIGENHHPIHVSTVMTKDHHAVPVENQRKKSNHSQVLASTAEAKRRFSNLIEQKKNKFKELNPIKTLTKHKTEDKPDQRAYFDDDNLDNKTKNMPKTYREYIKQAKKPKRLPPTTQSIIAAYLEQQNAKALLKQAQEQKPFLKKYMKQKQKSEKKEDNDQIEFVQQNLANIISAQIAETPEKDHPEESPLARQAELFFHKPRNQKNQKKKRKMLFTEQVIHDSNKSEVVEMIINKTKQTKNIRSKVQANAEAVKSPKRKTAPPSKQILMLTFLKSKYLAQDQVNAEPDHK